MNLFAASHICVGDPKILWSDPCFFIVRFQVEAPVARRSPHRPGREDFPHPVPRF